MAGSAASTVAFALGGAILLGAWGGEAWGAAAGAALGYLVAQRRHLAAQVEALRRRLIELEVLVRSLDRGAPAAKPAAEMPATVPRRHEITPPRAAANIASSEPAKDTLPRATAAPAAVSAASTAPPTSAPAAPNPFERAIGQAVAWLKGGNPVAKVGIVILFIGAAFLAKYAADHSMLPLELRLAGLGAGAIALLAVGWRLRDRRALYAQILQGGGIAGLYLVVFAAARLYQLVPHGFALPLMIAIATASALLAVAQSSLALAVIGFAGGFLAPVLLSTGGGSHVALFSYYAVLNAGVFTVAWFRAWRVLNLVGFVFTFTITAVWRSLAYRPENLASADFFLLLFFVMYVAISILFALRQKPELRGYVSGSLVFGLPVVVFTLQATLVSRIEYGLAYSALAFGAFYLALAWLLFRARHPHLRLLAEAFAALGVIFGSLAVPLAFDQQTTAAMWAVEGAGLLWLGLRQDRKLARAFGALLQLAAGLGYLAGLRDLSAGMPVLNTAYIGTLLLTVSGALTARWALRHAGTLAPYERGADTVALLWSTAWLLYGGLAEIHRSAPAQLDYGASLAYGGFVLALLVAAHSRWDWRPPVLLAMALAPAMALVALLAARDVHPFAEWGFLGWPALLGAGYLLLHALDSPPGEPARPWLHAGAYGLLAVVAAWELGWQLDQHVPGVWRVLPWGLVPGLLLWAANRPHPWPAWPLARHRETYQWHASAPLAAWSAAWVVVANLSNPGDPGWIPYVPLLNPLDVSSATVLTMLGLWVMALPPGRRALLRHRAFYAAAAALLFLWLNAALVRALHYGFDTPLTFHGIRGSVPVQAALSIFWTLLGLSVMFLSTRKGWRQAWLVGAGLMGAVVLKLFAIDLEGTGTIARIASFMSVGVLMLIAGYLSPLPPDAARKEAA